MGTLKANAADGAGADPDGVAGSRAGFAEAAAQPSGIPLRLLVATGGHGFQREPFAALLNGLPDASWSELVLPAGADRLAPGLEQEADVLVMYDMTRAFSPEQQAGFVALLERGIGVVALHHTLCAHRDWPEYTRIVGGRYLHAPETIGGVHHSPSTWVHDRSLHVRVADPGHPVTAGLADFTIVDETYGRFHVQPNVHVLLTTDCPDCTPEVAWCHSYGRSRVVYLMLGHDAQAWRHPVYAVLLSQAARWAAGVPRR